jgi:hypothetical protein
VQLTSTTDATASERSAGGSLLARLNHPIAVGMIGFIGWLIYVVARWQIWANGHISLFIMSGRNNKVSHPALMFPKISHVPSTGYDGQFYYRFALNPFNWNTTAYGITVDHNYRYTRIGFSVVAWIVSLGGHARLLPTVLVVLNLIFVGVMAWLGAKIARESGRHALWGLLFVAYFGLVISVGRDTSEPLADACMLGGLLAYRRARYVLAALLVGYGVFTNEPILVLAVAIAVTRLYQFWRKRARPGKPDLIWVLPGAVYVALQLAEKLVVKGKSGGIADASSNLTLPFKAIVPGVYRDIKDLSWTHLGMYDYNLIEFIALAVIVVAGFLVIRSSAAALHEKVAFAGFVLVEMVIASGQFWDSTFGDGRTYIDAFLMAVVILLAAPVGAVSGAVSEVSDGTRKAHASLIDRLFSADRAISNKRLGWLAAVAFAALVVVARRRVLAQ